MADCGGVGSSSSDDSSKLLQCQVEAPSEIGNDEPATPPQFEWYPPTQSTLHIRSLPLVPEKKRDEDMLMKIRLQDDIEATLLSLQACESDIHENSWWLRPAPKTYDEDMEWCSFAMEKGGNTTGASVCDSLFRLYISGSESRSGTRSGSGDGMTDDWLDLYDYSRSGSSSDSSLSGSASCSDLGSSRAPSSGGSRRSSISIYSNW